MATADGPLRIQSSKKLFDLAGSMVHTTFHKCSALIDRLPVWFFTWSTQCAVDATLAAGSLYLAYALRFDGAIPPYYAPVMWLWVAVLPCIRILSLRAAGCYEAIWRYFALSDAVLMILASLPATLLLFALRFVWRHNLLTVPVGVIVLELSIFLAFAGGARVFRRLTFESGLRAGVVRKRTLLVGSPNSLAGTLRQVSVYPDVLVTGMLSPDRKAHGQRIGGFAVIDEPGAMPELLARHAIDLVLIADASLESLGALVATAIEFGADVRLMPSAANIVGGDVRVSVLPKADESVLDRTAISQSEAHPAVVEAFRNRTVFVSGAGGSIGSELSRQVMTLPIRKLVLFDHDENSIFEINGELVARERRPEIAPVVGDIRDRDRLRAVFREHRPDIVLHAAAYKHVPMMEANCSEAVLNNVFGSREILQTSLDFEAERFLMISTDKAVRPSSIMGASKKIAELLVQAHGARNGHDLKTRCACVRFGNVVGSRGSVVPVFLRQIAAGGPVTITDQEMTRYFMTIPEAVQLVLQATTLGSHGDVYMLDMGNPVKIMDLARKLIVMSGLRPEQDIEIRVVGARPGEKIHEQLWYDDAQVTPTEFPRVFAVAANRVSEEFAAHLEALQRAALSHDDNAVRAVIQSLPIQFHTAQVHAAFDGNNSTSSDTESSVRIPNGLPHKLHDRNSAHRAEAR